MGISKLRFTTKDVTVAKLYFIELEMGRKKLIYDEIHYKVNCKVIKIFSQVMFVLRCYI